MCFSQLESKFLFYVVTGHPQDRLNATLMKTSAPTFGALRSTSSSLNKLVDACWNQHVHHLIDMRLSPHPFYLKQFFTPATVLNWLDEHRKPPFVIFLDIDGVLTDQSYEDSEDVPETLDEHHQETDRFSKTAINNLYEITRVASKTHDVWIVVSSDWRLGFKPEEIRFMFSKYDFSLMIFDKTIDHSDQTDLYCSAKHRKEASCRAAEINSWLKQHPKVEFIILDDNDGQNFHLSHNFAEKFIKVDPDKLLTDELMKSILHRHFNTPPPPFVSGKSLPSFSDNHPEKTDKENSVD